MARLEHIVYRPHLAIVANGTLEWEADISAPIVPRLPQIYWEHSAPWIEANLWATEVARDRRVKLRTVESLMEHVYQYANWLESNKVDWRHFPLLKAARVLDRYRGALIKARQDGLLSPSTTSARMRAVIRFYRYCLARGLAAEAQSMWQEKVAVIRYHDSVGFERSMKRATTDLSIPNRTRARTATEDGLLPINSEHMLELLRFAKQEASEELYLMLLMGFFTGARLGSVSTLNVPAIERAVHDPNANGMWVLAIGPGTGIETKFDVSGDLLIPDALMNELLEYAYSPRHLSRVIKANRTDKHLLFLTKDGKPFKPATAQREMVELRRKGFKSGLRFMQHFRFHQSRATFGTWLMTIALKETTTKLAIEFVMRAMHHKHESTTFRYIRFIEHTKTRIEINNEFTRAFFGLSGATKWT